jgi:hypothetical protein
VSRRTCPACARRYAGLVAEDCPVCDGVGTLGLGAAALATAEPSAVARAVELYLEGKARRANGRRPHTEHRHAVEEAVMELRSAGVLANASDRSAGRAARRHATGGLADSVAERKAVQLCLDLGETPTVETARALAPGRTVPLAQARRRGAPFPEASAAGYTAALCLATDPIDPLGPDVAALDMDRSRRDHHAAVLAGAVVELNRVRQRRAAEVS